MKHPNREPETARRAATTSAGDICPACGVDLVAKDGKLSHPYNLCHWDNLVLYPAMWRIIRLGIETDRAISASPEGTSFSWKDACEAAWKELKEKKP